MEYQGEEKAEGSWHSISRKLGFYALRSLNVRGCSSSKTERVRFHEGFNLSSGEIQSELTR